jgi:hypothetical protein
VKLHGGRVAVYEGTSSDLDAWVLPPGTPGLGRGDRVRVLVSPHLGHIREVSVLYRRSTT